MTFITIHLENTIRQICILMKKIFLFLQSPQEDGLLWNQNVNRKHHFEGGRTQEGRLTNSYVDSLYKELFKHYNETSDVIHHDNFRCQGKQLYFKGKDEPLTNDDRKLKTFDKLKSILGKNKLCNLGFDVPGGKLTPQQSVILNKTEEELPSTSDVTKVDDIELQEITENASRSTENLIQQPKGESSKNLLM